MLALRTVALVAVLAALLLAMTLSAAPAPAQAQTSSGAATTGSTTAVGEYNLPPYVNPVLSRQADDPLTGLLTFVIILVMVLFICLAVALFTYF